MPGTKESITTAQTTLNPHVPTFIPLDETIIGTGRSRAHSPVDINLAVIPTAEQIKDDTTKFYEDNFLSNPTQLLTTPPNNTAEIGDIAFAELPTTATAEAKEAKAAANRIMDGLDEGVVLKLSKDISKTFADFRDTVEKELNPALTTNLGVNQKVVKLSKLYYDTADKLDTAHQNELKEFDNWFKNHKNDLAKVYPEQFSSDEIGEEKAQQNLKEVYTKQKAAIEKRQNDEKAYLKELQASLASAIYDVNEFNAVVLGNYFERNYKLHNPHTGEAAFSAENAIKDGTYHDRFGYEFKVENNTTKVDFAKIKGLSEGGRMSAMVDRAAAIRHADLAERAELIKKLKEEGKLAEIEKLPPLRIKISATVRNPHARWFLPEHEKYTSDLPYTSYMLSQQWRAAIQAGYKPEEIDAPMGFTPTEADKNFARAYMAKESYKGLGEANTAVQKKLAENSDHHLNPSRLQRIKNSFRSTHERNKERAKVLNENTVPILTDNDINEIANKIDPFKFDVYQKSEAHPASLESMRKEFNTIRPGLGDVLLGKKVFDKDKEGKTILGKDYEQATEFVREMRGDYINNSAARDFLLRARDDAGIYVIDKLTRKQIDAINKLQFKHEKDTTAPADSIVAKTPEDIAEKIQEAINIPGEPKIDLKTMDFGFRHQPTHVEYTTDHRSQYTIACNDLLGVDKVLDAQKDGQKKAAVTTPSEAVLKARLDENKKTLVAVRTEIKENLARIKELKANSPMSQEQLEEFQTLCQTLARNYNHLAHLTDQQIEMLDQMRKQIKANQGFEHASVADAYKEIALGHRDDIITSIELLKTAGQVSTGAVDADDQPIYEEVVTPTDFTDNVPENLNASIKKYNDGAKKLMENGDELATNIHTDTKNSTKNKERVFDSLTPGKTLVEETPTDTDRFAIRSA